MLALPFFLGFAVCQVWAAVNDSRTMLIPNWISVALLAGFMAITPLVWAGWEVFGWHLASGFGVFLIGFTMYALGFMGGGDAKLMSATAFWFVPHDLFSYAFTTAVAGGALALILLVGRKFIPVKLLTSQWLYKMFKDEKKMPYGIALAIGALLTLPESDIYLRAMGG